jgi:DNA repair ATPase RecN
MNFLRRITGSGIILLASVVFVLCLAGIVGVWIAKSRVDVLGDSVFQAADASLAFMNGKLDRIEAGFKKVHRRVGILSKEADRLSQQATQSEAASLLKTLDEEVFEPLKTAEKWLDSTHAVAVGVGQVSEAVVSSKYAAAHEDSVGVAMAGQLQDISESVVEILTTLKEVRQRLIDIRDDVLSARRIALIIVSRLAQVEKRMENLCGRIEKFHASVGEMQGEIIAVRENFHWWTMLGAVLATLLLVWFTASQIGMVLHGWAMAKRKPQ